MNERVREHMRKLAERVRQEKFTQELYCRLFNAVSGVIFEQYQETGRHATQEEVQTALDYFVLRFWEDSPEN